VVSAGTIQRGPRPFNAGKMPKSPRDWPGILLLLLGCRPPGASL